jgi:hypothetical protein
MEIYARQGQSLPSILSERGSELILQSLYSLFYYGMCFHLLCFEPQNVIWGKYSSLKQFQLVVVLMLFGVTW